jgi:methylated-DNA-protein-cysteine methyltransferase-like protein
VDEHVRTLYRNIYAVVRRIPKGKVATYGQVAELAGIPGGARVAGAAMRGSGQAHPRVPWQRVVGKRGGNGVIAILDPIGGAVQRELLEREGVDVGDKGTIPLSRYGWLPLTRKVRASRGRGAPPRRPPRSGSRRRASPSRR